jgi:hypothetical protein
VSALALVIAESTATPFLLSPTVVFAREKLRARFSGRLDRASSTALAAP